jgi:hypothetical protein
VTIELSQGRHDPQVFAWRRDRLIESGFPAQLAARLAADSRFDLHSSIELAERGCPPELVVRIMAPLEDAGPA